jgi:CheY-like chemotaxis protein
MKVLVVDDDEGFREAISAVLTLEGIGVELAENGREALARLASMRPDAVLVDLMMPVMSGWELLDAMNRDPAMARIPTAVISAARNPGRLPSSVVVLRKPCDLGAVVRFLQSARTGNGASA